MPTLNWLTRREDIQTASKAPYRLLEEVRDLSGGDLDVNLSGGQAGNMLIQGDNLDALKSLLPFYAGQVKCVYIDPPYNTHSAFEHYDDNLEHTKWLAMMWPRLEILREFLMDDGSIWINIDDDEGHYLKVIADEIYGRRNFIVNCVWQKRTSPDGRINMGDAHDHILVYGRRKARDNLNNLSLSDEQRSSYKNPDNDLRGSWVSTDFTAQGYRPNQMYEIVTPAGKRYSPPSGRCWANVEERFLILRDEGRIWFGKGGKSRPRVKNYLSEAKGVKSWSWWANRDVGHNQEAKKEINVLFGASNAFDTPKPERLIQRILHIATGPGDLILDSFLGSGTTAAVAHKMDRRWIGIEMGDHAVTHCVPRLNKVIAGEQGGISRSVAWQGGGAFRFYRLGPAVFNEEGHIRSDVRFSVLAAHVYFSETGCPWSGNGDSPFLGVHEGRAYALLHDGVQGGKRPGPGNVLTHAMLKQIREEIMKDRPDFVAETPDYPLTIYGEQSRLMPPTLRRARITFKQTPYDVKSRA